MINERIAGLYQELAQNYKLLCEAWQLINLETERERDYWKEKAEFLELVARKG